MYPIAILVGLCLLNGQLTSGLSLISKNSTRAATKQEVLEYLSYISGTRTASGQHNREPNSDPTKWTRVVRDITGLYPGLWGGDFLFLPDDVRNRQFMVDEAIRQWNAGSLVALTWHACPPTVGETCNWDSEGVLARLTDQQWTELITDGTYLHNQWKARMDAIVPYLRQLEHAGVVAIFRPIHEMNEGWSWWGGRPGPYGSRELYRFTYWYFVEYYGLHNMIWTWNVKDVGMNSIADYWPGNEYVDVVSLDVWMKAFPSADDYQQILTVAGGKPIALAEVAAIPSPSVMSAQPRWVWWMVWAEYLKDEAFNTDESVKEAYYMPRTLRQGDIPILSKK